MNERDANDLLHRLAGDVQEVPPPVARLVAGGRTMRRRRHLRNVVWSAVVSGVVLSGGAVALYADEGAGRDPGYIGRDQQPTAPPSAAPGTRMVGLGRVAVEVPQEWVIAENGCARDTGVVFRYPDTPKAADRLGECPAFPANQPSASLAVGDATSPLGSKEMEASTWSRAVDVGGLSVMQTSFHHSVPDFCGPGAAPGYQQCDLLFWAPAEDTFFHVGAHGPGAQETVLAIRDSIQILPEGYTSVPFIAYGTEDADAAQVMEEAGLEAELPDVKWPHSVVATEPEAGSVVEAGSIVRLIPGDG